MNSYQNGETENVSREHRCVSCHFHLMCNAHGSPFHSLSPCISLIEGNPVIGDGNREELASKLKYRFKENILK